MHLSAAHGSKTIMFFGAALAAVVAARYISRKGTGPKSYTWGPATLSFRSVSLRLPSH